MEFGHGRSLAYCTNIHRGETWRETFAALEEYTLRVKARVCPDRPYGIGLRLSAEAAQELRDSAGGVQEFRNWLEQNGCYVFTINGFPYATFHGERVKEQVFVPDWTEKARLDYTCLLFDLLGELLPEGMEGSVSTLPGSFKEFIKEGDGQEDLMVQNLLLCHRHIQQLREKTGQDLHLGLEPEPLGYFETSAEAVDFFQRLRDGARAEGLDENELLRNIGINYDTCHLAVEFEEAGAALTRLREAGIRISKIHLSSALSLRPTEQALERLGDFQEDVYLHQVVVREGQQVVHRFRDLPEALAFAGQSGGGQGKSLGDEWRVHFHVPIHARLEGVFGDTQDHILAVLEELKNDPGMCSHFEIETYTWAVLPEALRSGDVVDQIVKEYQWCLAAMEDVG